MPVSGPNPSRGDIEVLIEYLGEKIQDDYTALEDSYAVEIEDLDTDPDALDHLDEEDRKAFDNELTGLRNVAKTYDWLIKFMSAEMDETGAFDGIPSVEDWAPGEIMEAFGK